MKLRRIRLLLWAAAGVMTGLALLSIFWANSASLDLGNQERSQSSISKNAPNAVVKPGITTKDFQQLAQLNLRRPLHDPPHAPVAPAITGRQVPPLTIRLAGTIVEPGHCRAMIQLADGSVELKGIGDVAGEARITDIQEGKVTVEYFGASLQLTVPKEKGS
jgi:hypothetical protein